MSKGRVFSRPRTKVYDSNYNIGESYYKPAIDKLDQKYGGRGFGGFGDFDRGTFANGDLFGMRPPPPPSPMDLPAPRPTLREVDDEIFGEGPRRRPNSALLGEYDAIFEGRMRNGMAGQERPPPSRGGRNLDEEIEEDLASSMKRLRAKATRSFAEEMEDMESNFGKKETRMRPRLDFGEKLMESVGLGGKARQALEDEGAAIGRRRILKMTSEPGEGEEMTKWTALKPSATSTRSRFFEEEEESSVQTSGAAARARKSRARLDDLESEMQALSEKNAAREKRVRDLKAFVQENEGGAMENLHTTIRMKSSVQSEKKSLAY